MQVLPDSPHLIKSYQACYIQHSDACASQSQLTSGGDAPASCIGIQLQVAPGQSQSLASKPPDCEPTTLESTNCAAEMKVPWSPVSALPCHDTCMCICILRGLAQLLLFSIGSMLVVGVHPVVLRSCAAS